MSRSFSLPGRSALAAAALAACAATHAGPPSTLEIRQVGVPGDERYVYCDPTSDCPAVTPKYLRAPRPAPTYAREVPRPAAVEPAPVAARAVEADPPGVRIIREVEYVCPKSAAAAPKRRHAAPNKRRVRPSCRSGA